MSSSLSPQGLSRASSRGNSSRQSLSDSHGDVITHLPASKAEPAAGRPEDVTWEVFDAAAGLLPSMATAAVASDELAAGQQELPPDIGQAADAGGAWACFCTVQAARDRPTAVAQPPALLTDCAWAECGAPPAAHM